MVCYDLVCCVQVLFNDALNTFYLSLYGVGYMGKDHSDCERGKQLSPHWLLFQISSNISFICTIPQRIAHTTAFVTPVMEHWLEWKIVQWAHHEGYIVNDLNGIQHVINTQQFSRVNIWNKCPNPPKIARWPLMSKNGLFLLNPTISHHLKSENYLCLKKIIL